MSGRTRRFRRDTWRRATRSFDAGNALDGVGCAFDLTEILVWFGVAIVVLILLLALAPLVAGLLELLVLLVVAVGAVVTKVVFRRPWVVEAEALDGPRAGRLLAWRIVGWRASGQQVVDVARRLEAGVDLPPGAHEGRACARPGRRHIVTFGAAGGILLAMDTAPAAGATSVEAATIVLLRDVGAGVECLMLQKTRGQSFGGHWVFPGGRVEPGDGDGDDGIRTAAVREAREETGLVLDAAALVPLSHWVPPLEAPKRFSTWFFLAHLPDGADDVVIDGGEIGDQMWITATAALERHGRHEAQLAPPTWVTLHWLAEAPSIDAALAKAAAGEVEHFSTRMVDHGGELVALWAPDVAYEGGDLTAAGPRHRLLMRRGPWVFERR